MFKNRVRTAALAGAIAVATGVSGIAVPANAEEGRTPVTDNGLNTTDASQGQGGTNTQNIAPVGEVRAATKLKAEADADATAIGAHKFFPVKTFQTRPIEASTKAQLEAKEKEATDLLDRSVKTLNDIDATLTAVEAEIKAANDAWAAYATATTLSASERAALAKYARDIQAPQSIITAIDELWVVNKKPGDVGYVEEVNTVANHPDAVEKFQALVGHLSYAINTDAEYILNSEYNPGRPENPGQSVELIEASEKASAVASMLSGYLKGYNNRNTLKAEAVEKTLVANSRNVVVLRQAWERARSNVRAARTLEAYYGVAARWVGLYENDTVLQSEGTTLRTEYFNLLFNSNDGSRVGNGNKGDVYLEEAARAAVANVDSDLRWENEVSRVRLLDKKYRTDYATKPGTQVATNFEKPSDVARVADELAKLNNKENSDDNSGNDNNGSDNNGDKPAPGKTPGGMNGATIAAIVIGVLAALGGIVAVAFPHIQQFLPKF